MSASWGAGSSVASALAGLPEGMRLVGCFDVDAERVGRRWPPRRGDGALAASSLEDLLRASDVDLVVVAAVHDQLAAVDPRGPCEAG